MVLAKRLECQLRCGNLGNPHWHDLCSSCFCKYALHPACAAEAFLPGLARAVQPLQPLQPLQPTVLGAARAAQDLELSPPRAAPRAAPSEPLCLWVLTTLQVGVHIFSVVFNGGYESLWMNPLIGPSPASLYTCGGLFVDGGQYWRMASSLFLSIGAVQLIPGLFVQWTLGTFVEQRLGFQRTLEVLLLSSASGSLLSAWGHLNQRRLTVGAWLPLHGLLTRRLSLVPRGAEERFAWRATVFFLTLSLLLALLLPILDFPGRLGALLGGLVATVLRGERLATNSRTVLAAKALTLLLAALLWGLGLWDLTQCPCATAPSDDELRVISA